MKVKKAPREWRGPCPDCNLLRVQAEMYAYMNVAGAVMPSMFFGMVLGECRPKKPQKPWSWVF